MSLTKFGEVITRLLTSGSAIALLFFLSWLDAGIPSKLKVILFMVAAYPLANLAREVFGNVIMLYGISIFGAIEALILFIIILEFAPMIYNYYQMWGVGG